MAAPGPDDGQGHRVTPAGGGTQAAASFAVPSAGSDHPAAFHWLLFTGTIVIALFVTLHQGWLPAALQADRSYLSLLILVFFAGTSAYLGRAVVRLAREAATLSGARADFAAGAGATLEWRDGEVRCNGAAWPISLLQRHVRRLMERQSGGGLAPEQHHLLEALAEELRAPVRTGWMLADLMIKLGLLGTVVGFILMLGALSGASDLDLSTLRSLLTTLGSGMGVALYTTLFGLLAGGLAGWQVHLLENAGERLLAEFAALTETQVLPRLGRAPAPR